MDRSVNGLVGVALVYDEGVGGCVIGLGQVPPPTQMGTTALQGPSSSRWRTINLTQAPIHQSVSSRGRPTGLRVPVSADVVVSVGDGENIDNAVKRFKREVSALPWND